MLKHNSIFIYPRLTFVNTIVWVIHSVFTLYLFLFIAMDQEMTVMQNGMYIFYYFFIYNSIIKQSRNVTLTYCILTNFWENFNSKIAL